MRRTQNLGKGGAFSKVSPKISNGYGPHAFLFVLALGIRFFFLIYIDEPILFFKYPFFAEKLIQGKDIGARLVDLSPFYLYCLVALKKFFISNWSTVKVFQAFIGALNSLLVFSLGSRLFGKVPGFIGAFLYAVYGNLIILETTLEPTVFVLLFNLLSVYFLFLANPRPNSLFQCYGPPMIAGIFTGLSIITKPSFLLFPLLGVVWLFGNQAGKPPLREKILRILLFCVAAVIVVMPITLRNYIKLNDFILVTADAGKVFYHGNGTGATALEGTDLPGQGFAEEGTDEPDYAHTLFRHAASKLSGKELKPSEASNFWKKRTLNHIFNDPKAFLKLESKKILFFFTDYEMHYIASAYKEYKASLSFPFIRYGIISSLGILGIFLSIRKFKETYLIHGIVCIYLLSGLLFLVQSRYRTPAVPYLCIFSGVAVFRLREMLGMKRFKSVVFSVLFAGVLFFLTHFIYSKEIICMDKWQEATKIHYQMDARPLYDKREYRKALSALNACIALTPNFSPAYNLKGKCHAILGEYKKALKNFNKVILLSPNIEKGYKNIGFLYLLQDDAAMAEPYLRKALALSPDNTKIKDALKKLRAVGF